MVNGKDDRLPIDKQSNTRPHTGQVVYRSMLLAICRNYNTLPDPRTLTMDEIVFFYRGISHEFRTRKEAKSRK